MKDIKQQTKGPFYTGGEICSAHKMQPFELHDLIAERRVTPYDGGGTPLKILTLNEGQLWIFDKIL